jgi:hypothetical protein
MRNTDLTKTTDSPMICQGRIRSLSFILLTGSLIMRLASVQGLRKYAELPLFLM